MDEKKYQLIIKNVQPLSVNSSFYGNKRHGYTTDAKATISQICSQINSPSNQSAINALKRVFKAGEHAFAVDYSFKTPNFFTKSGQISSKSQDLDNVIKILQDVVFGESFHGIDSIYKSLNLNEDDKQIIKLSASKTFGPEYEIKITINILPIPSKDQ